MKFQRAAAAVAIAAFVGVGLYVNRPPPREEVRVLHPPSVAPPVMNAFTPRESGAARAATATATATAPTPQAPPTAALHSKATEFVRLTGPQATPAMLSQAWELASVCRVEDSLLLRGKQVHEDLRCQLPPGPWREPATVKRMLEARVERVDFGAFADVMAERSGAFADDQARWRQLVELSYETGKAKAEPTVMAYEAQGEFIRGNELRQAGQIAEAQAAYRQAVVYAVASAVNTGVQAGAKLDPAQDARVIEMSAKLPADQRPAVINEGEQLARNWKKSS